MRFDDPEVVKVGSNSDTVILFELTQREACLACEQVTINRPLPIQQWQIQQWLDSFDLVEFSFVAIQFVVKDNKLEPIRSENCFSDPVISANKIPSYLESIFEIFSFQSGPLTTK